MSLLTSNVVRRYRTLRTPYALNYMSRSRRWRRNFENRKEARALVHAAKMGSTDYSAWSNEKLIERVTQLEQELKSKTQSAAAVVPEKRTWKKPRTERVFDPSKYSTRLIALKLAYLGKRYNGFEYHSGNKTPLPTIEEELWKALNKARLIFPKDCHPLAPGEVNWEGTEYSKCGRTDKGVSAFGQVIGIRVRSNRPLGVSKAKDSEAPASREQDHGTDEITVHAQSTPNHETQGFDTFPRENGTELASPTLSALEDTPKGNSQQILASEEVDYTEALNFDPVADEIPYISLLNRLLPPDIRILAWCPSPPLDFSARFSCRERQYRYFFTQPAFSPLPHNLEPSSKNVGMIKGGWLDIQAMQEAARSFEGTHDFRNFCKVDGGKQISNFERRIFHADIEEVVDHTSALAYLNASDFSPRTSVPRDNPKVYTFTLHGSAFLWHQVRHMVAILFLVGQGLEQPSIVSELLDTKTHPRRPAYEMATDTPLVLWDCIFPYENDPERKDAMQWLYAGDEPRSGDTKYGSSGLMDELWKVWRERKVDEMLAGTLMGVVAAQGKDVSELEVATGRVSKSQKVFDGDCAPRLQGTYVSVMKKPLLETVEVINQKYAARKGFETAEEFKAQNMGFRRLKLE